MQNLILNNLINIAYLVSFFSNLTLAILLAILSLFLCIFIFKRHNKYTVKNKIFAFITLNLFFIIYDFVNTTEVNSPFIACIIAVLIFLNLLAVFYYASLMLIYSISEAQELKQLLR